MIAHSRRAHIFKYSISTVGFPSAHFISVTVKVLNLHLESLRFSFMIELNTVIGGENHGR